MAQSIQIAGYLDENGNVCDTCTVIDGQLTDLAGLKCNECEQYRTQPLFYARCRSLCQPPQTDEDFSQLLNIPTPEQSAQTIKKTVVIMAVVIAAILAIYIVTQ